VVELKTVQAVIPLIVFAGFSGFYLRKPPGKSRTGIWADCRGCVCAGGGFAARRSSAKSSRGYSYFDADGV